VSVHHQRPLETMNLFTWPAKDTTDRSFVKDGFEVTEWSRNGVRYAVVSDIPAPQLRKFEELFLKQSA
ncbi:MAG TPA: hypothetical protein VJ846_10840, partial [Sphingomicrobium sp.]|nr:hypothetical protein [Sphingomicrobium sp.]